MADYSKKLREMQETEEQSDSGMMRSDETKARLKDLGERIRKSELAGAGRGFVNPPTVGEMARSKSLDAAIGPDVSEATRDEIKRQVRERGVERMSEKAYNRIMPPEAAGMKKGGSVSSASKRADGIAQRGKTRGTMVACGGGYMKGKT